jgi:hypothetical protein
MYTVVSGIVLEPRNKVLDKASCGVAEGVYTPFVRKSELYCAPLRYYLLNAAPPADGAPYPECMEISHKG